MYGKRIKKIIVCFFIFYCSLYFIWGEIVFRSKPDIPESLSKISADYTLITKKLASEMPDCWPKEVWKDRFYTKKQLSAVTSICYRLYIPYSSGYLYFRSTSPVKNLIYGHEDQISTDCIIHDLNSCYIRINEELQGKYLYIIESSTGFIDCDCFFSKELKNLKEYRKTLLVYKRGELLLDLPYIYSVTTKKGSSGWIRDCGFGRPVRIRGNRSIYRVLLPDWSIKRPWIRLYAGFDRSFSIFLNGKKLCTLKKLGSESEDVIYQNNSFYFQLPVNWQNSILDIHLDHPRYKFMPRLSLCVKNFLLPKVIDENRVPLKNQVLGWGGLILGLGLIVLNIIEKKQKQLFFLGICFLLIAYLYGPADFRFFVVDLLGYKIDSILFDLATPFFSLTFYLFYFYFTNDSRKIIRRFSLSALSAWTGIAFVISFINNFYPKFNLSRVFLDSRHIAPADFFSRYLQYRTLNDFYRNDVFLYMLAIIMLIAIICSVKENKRQSTTRLFLIILIIHLLTMYFLYIILDLLPVSFNYSQIDCINTCAWGIILLLLITVPIKDFFYTERELEKKNTELTKLNNVFVRFVPQQCLDAIGIADITEIKLGLHQSLRLSVLFADIRGFTGISESLDASKTFAFINEYLQLVAPVIDQEGGFIDKYLGDGVMAVFPDDPVKALHASIKIQHVLDTYNMKRLAKNELTVKVGIGIHYGDAMLGMIGHENRMDTTVISDTVNIACRLQSITKHYNSRIIVSNAFRNQLPVEERELIMFLDRVCLYGKEKPVSMFEVVSAWPENMIEKKRKAFNLLEKIYKSDSDRPSLIENMHSLFPDFVPGQKINKDSFNNIHKLDYK